MDADVLAGTRKQLQAVLGLAARGQSKFELGCDGDSGRDHDTGEPRPPLVRLPGPPPPLPLPEVLAIKPDNIEEVVSEDPLPKMAVLEDAEPQLVGVQVREVQAESGCSVGEQQVAVLGGQGVEISVLVVFLLYC